MGLNGLVEPVIGCDLQRNRKNKTDKPTDCGLLEVIAKPNRTIPKPMPDVQTQITTPTDPYMGYPDSPRHLPPRVAGGRVPVLVGR